MSKTKTVKRTDNIENMNFKELRTEVQLLRDELAIFKRKYEDAIYNLDSDNFGKSFTVEQNNMKAQIKVTADAITTMVSDTDLATALEQYSKITQTAEAIQTVVSKSADLENAVEISSLSQRTDVTKTYVIREKTMDDKVKDEKYYYYNNLTNTWELLIGNNIHTVFEQTAEGFLLRGNTVIDGNATITRNLTLSGHITWDMSNSPVLSQYSSNDSDWHSPMESGDVYMRMSFDGGQSWSTSTKVVGTDGIDGVNGSDANVTSENVFNALTNNGATQGIFAAFVNKENQLYINAEYIQTETLKATRLYSTQGSYYAKVYSSFGDFGLYSGGAGATDTPESSSCVWGIYNSDAVVGAVNFYAYGNNYLGYNQTIGTTFAKGKWDFSNCPKVVWGNNAPVAKFG